MPVTGYDKICHRNHRSAGTRHLPPLTRAQEDCLLTSSGVTDEMMAEERDQVTGSNPEGYPEPGGYREGGILKTGALCAIGK